jgi:regulator of protease activity HflC (stomatin/prohibitin superfamily)
MKKIISLILIAFFVSSCAVIKQDQVAMKRTLGKLSGKKLESGFYVYNPFITTMLYLPINTVNLEVSINLPSKEGLTIASEISILYSIDRDKIQDILISIGPKYEQELILPVFRSASADVCARFVAKDLHSGERYIIEKQIKDRMTELIKGRGFNIEAVLMKSIRLPNNLVNAIEAKLSAEQDAMRMKFVIDKEKLEAERKLIEAEGTRNAQKVLSDGLTDQIIKIQSIEAFKELSKSPNAKVIITDGKTPFLIQNE